MIEDNFFLKRNFKLTNYRQLQASMLTKCLLPVVRDPCEQGSNLYYFYFNLCHTNET